MFCENCFLYSLLNICVLTAVVDVTCFDRNAVDAGVVLRCETMHIPQHRGQHNAQESAHREREKH